MTDRIKGFTVVLEADMRSDDFESIKNAVSMIRGVAAVTPSIANPEDWLNRERVRQELHAKLFGALHEKAK